MTVQATARPTRSAGWVPVALIAHTIALTHGAGWGINLAVAEYVIRRRRTTTKETAAVGS